MKRKPQSAAYLLRRVNVWKARYELVVDSRRAQAKEIKKYRDQVRDLLERKVRELRVANEGLRAATSTLAANNVEIQELKDQVAVQWKQRSEAETDVKQYKVQAADAITKHNRMVQRVDELQCIIGDLEADAEHHDRRLEAAKVALIEARLRFSYRLWFALRDSYHLTTY